MTRLVIRSAVSRPSGQSASSCLDGRVGLHQTHVNEDLLEVRLGVDSPVARLELRVCDGPAQVAVSVVPHFGNEESTNLRDST